MGQPRRNLELKVACSSDDLATRRDLLAASGIPVVAHLRQKDTYFQVATGRLKLRRIEEEREGAVRSSAELITYHRPDVAESRWSDYTLAPLAPDEADGRETALATSHGTLVVVSKRRDLALWGTTRIHLDEVDSLGCFIELETVSTGQPDADAQREHERVIQALLLDRLPVVAGSYSDLLLGRQHTDRTRSDSSR